MTNIAEWTAIANACECATGPETNLDWRIALALGVVRLAAREGAPAYAHALLKAQEIVEVPRYTASLDAITDAIGKHLLGWHWEAGADGCAMLRRSPWAFAGDDFVCWEASTPALALCAALARAMAAKVRADALSELAPIDGEHG